MKRNYIKMLLTAVMLCVGASVWGSTLTEDYQVAGYKVKAYYDLANENPDDMCPTSGDFRYRGSGFGWFNFGSGNRGADVTLSVTAGDLLIAEFRDTQGRSVTINSITGCTLNTTNTNGNILAFDVASDATSLNVNIGRGGCIIAFLVMEKDESANEYSYSIIYRNGEDVVRTQTGIAADGAVIKAESSFHDDNGVKYVADEELTLTVSETSTTLYVDVQEAQKCSYTVIAIDDETKATLATLTSGSCYIDDNVTVPYPRYVLQNGTLYEKGVTNKEYRTLVTVTEDNQTIQFVYTQTEIKNVVYCSEGENIPGAVAVSEGNMNIRSSLAACGQTPEDENLLLATLPAGEYKATMVCYANSSVGATQTFMFGGTEYEATITGASNGTQFTTDFTLDSQADIFWLCDGSSRGKNGLDFIYIQRTDIVSVEISKAGYATLYCDRALNFADVEGLKAYVVTDVKGSALTMPEVGSVPANTPVILQGNAARYMIPIISDAESIEGNLLVGVNTDSQAEDGWYVLQSQENGVGFYLVDTSKATPTVGAGHAYLHVAAGAKAFMLDDNATAIETLSAPAPDATETIYGVSGIRQNGLQRGINIVRMTDGKIQKVMVK